MATDIGALILFTARVEQVVAFYRGIGVPLEEEDHGDGVTHFACELARSHFAVFDAGTGDAPAHRSGGSTFFGLAVDSTESAVRSARETGATVVQEPTPYPWGIRALVTDPDGRTVELFERSPQESADGDQR